MLINLSSHVYTTSWITTSMFQNTVSFSLLPSLLLSFLQQPTIMLCFHDKIGTLVVVKWDRFFDQSFLKLGNQHERKTSRPIVTGLVRFFLPQQSEMEQAVYLHWSSACFGCTVIPIWCTLHALLLRRFWWYDKGNRYWNHFLLTHLDVALFGILVMLPWQHWRQFVQFFCFEQENESCFWQGHGWYVFICLLCANNTGGVPFVTTIMRYSLQLVILECHYPLACDCKHWIGVMCVFCKLREIE